MRTFFRWFGFYGAHPARHGPGLQLLSAFFLLLAGCVSAPPADLGRWVPEGYYVFDCPIVYDNGLARISHTAGGARVQLLEDVKGSFILRVDNKGALEIVDADMHYPGLKRSFKGGGLMSEPGRASGRAIAWLKTLGPISRDHRAGPWTLRPATEKEIERHLEKRRKLEERRRTRENGLS